MAGSQVCDLDSIVSPLIGLQLDEVEYRLHCCNLQTRLRRRGDVDFGPPDGFFANRVNLTTTRLGKVIAYTIG